MDTKRFLVEIFNGDGLIASIMYGSDGADFIEGTSLDDIIFAKEGANNVLGNDGDDTIDGGQGADRISGGDGGDTLTGGAGADVFVQGNGDSVAYTAQTAFSANTLVAAGTIVFANSVDVITDFNNGGLDLIDVATAADLTILAADNGSDPLELGRNYLIRGVFDANTSLFTQSDTGIDALILFNAQNPVLEAADNNNWLVATGAGASLVAANFI